MEIDLKKSFQDNLKKAKLSEKEVEGALSDVSIQVGSKRGGAQSEDDASIIGKAAIIAAVARAAKAVAYTGAAGGILFTTHELFSKNLCGHLTTAALRSIPTGILGSLASPFANQCTTALSNYEFAIKVAMVPITALLAKAGGEVAQLVVPKDVLDNVVNKLLERFKSVPPAPAVPVAAAPAPAPAVARPRAESESSSSSDDSEDSAIMGQYDPDSKHYNPDAGRRRRKRTLKKKSKKTKKSKKSRKSKKTRKLRK
jgi:hypothetical protein